jgi:hypothetical protein
MKFVLILTMQHAELGKTRYRATAASPSFARALFSTVPAKIFGSIKQSPNKR